MQIDMIFFFLFFSFKKVSLVFADRKYGFCSAPFLVSAKQYSNGREKRFLLPYRPPSSQWAWLALLRNGRTKAIKIATKKSQDSFAKYIYI